jgi:hypothetical protein
VTVPFGSPPSPSAVGSGASMSPSMVSGVPADSIRDPEGPGDLRIFCSAAEVSGFVEYPASGLKEFYCTYEVWNVCGSRNTTKDIQHSLYYNLNINL